MSVAAEEPVIAAEERKEPPFAIPGGLRGKLAWIAELWRPHRGALVFLFAFTLVSSGVAIAYPLVFKLVLDRIGEGLASGTGGLPRALLQNALVMLGAIAVARFLAGFYPGARAYMNLTFDRLVRTRVFTAMLGKDHRFFRQFRTGDLVTRLLDDISEYPKISWFLCSGFFRALDSGSKIVFCVAAMFLLDWRLSLLAVLPLPLLLWCIYSVRQKLTSAYDAQAKAVSETNDLLEATFSGVRIVKAFRAEEGQARALDDVLGRRFNVQFRVQRLWALFFVLETTASRVGQLVVLGAGGVMVLRQEMTLGTLYALFVYLDLLVQPMMDLPNVLVTARQAFVSIDRVEEVRAFPEGRTPASRGLRKELSGERGSGASIPLERIDRISFREVAVEYQPGRPVLRAISFDLARGETIALVGSVGAGKTTVLRLLAGLLDPLQGTITVNGRPLAEYDPESYRRRVGYAPQESLLFSESIAENVRLGRGEIGASTEARVTRALEIAQMGEELRAMPAGADTVLGQKGTLVSGGQRQRVSIARAIFESPELLLLDDCTASLDARNEDQLWRDLQGHCPEAIVLVVSHRLATIRRADRILVFDQGTLVDQGSHPELSGRCDAYRGFLTREEERERVGA